MSSTKSYARSRSLPPRAHLNHPQPARDHKNYDGRGSVAAARRRSLMPRAVLNPNLQTGAGVINTNSTFLDLRDSILVDDEVAAAFRDIAREQIDADSLRELARFFRNTEPPSRAPSFDVGGNDCLGTSAMGMRGDKKRWSIQSLRKRRGKKTASLSVHLPETAVPRTTTAGNSYIAISVADKAAAAVRSTDDVVRGRMSLPRHGRLSNLTMSGIMVPGELEWLKNTEAMREEHEEEDREDQTVRSQSTGPRDMPTSPTITVLTAPGTAPMTPLTALSSHPLHPPIPERPPSSECPPPRSAVILSEVGSPGLPLRTSPDSKVSFSQPASSPPPEPQRPRSSPSAPPKLLAHRRQLSAFPTKRPKSSSSRGSASSRTPSPMASPKQHKQQRSQSQPKKPSNIVVKGRLEVPPATNQLPDSPGFPNMLAAITFPSPPETTPIHSPSSSISSAGPVSAAPAAATARRTSSKAFQPSSMDQRVMQQDTTQPTRPPLRKHRSDGGPIIAFTSQKSIASSIGTYHGEGAELAVAQAAEICGQPAAAAAHEAAGDETQARSEDSLTDSEQFETASESYRHSMLSDTTETSFSTEMSTRGRERERSSRRESTDILTRKRSSRLHRQSWASFEQTTDDDRRTADSERSSIMSASSSGTVKTSTSSTADRRMARKAKIREKFQKDLSATKVNSLTRHPDQPGATVFMDAVDSPVLGRFPQVSPGGGALPLRAARRTSVPGPSPLAAQAASDPDEQDAWSRHASRRSSIQDVAHFIPHTVPEDAATASPTTPRAPVSGEPYNKETEKEAGSPNPLTLTSVMVVASIETGAPSTPTTTALRPLSLLSTSPGVSPPITGPRLPIRPEGKGSARQRPLPIKVATITKSNRKSVPNMPTPPLSAELLCSVRHMSLPIQKSLSAQTPSRPWARQSLITNVADHSSTAHDKETQWLLAHQKETAQEWRMAALRERTRLERLAEEKEAATEDDQDVSDARSEAEEDPEGKGEVARSLREKTSSRSIASSTTRTKNREDTLDVLNTNATKAEDDTSAGGKGDDDASCVASPTDTAKDIPASPQVQNKAPATIDPSIEERLQRLERNGEIWLSVVMPLLQDMNRMLRDLKRGSIGQEMTMKIMDTALAAGLGSVPSLDAAATAANLAGKQKEEQGTDDVTKA